MTDSQEPSNLESDLQEAYDRGRQDGLKEGDRAGYVRGQRAGYREAMQNIRKALRTVSEHPNVVTKARAEPAPLHTRVDDEEFGLSVQAYRVLTREGIDTLEDVLSAGETRLEDIRNFGTVRIDEVKNRLKDLGHKLTKEGTKKV